MNKQYKYDEDEIKIIIELVKSLNMGNSNEDTLRVEIAIQQYEQIKKKVMYAEVE